jgi:DNA-binding NarL/FixJ family response regulator
VAEQLGDPRTTRFTSHNKEVMLIPMSLNDQLPPHLRPVLRELVLGTVDATACRRLKISPRTFTRRVAELLDHLGVESRFQAGMQVMFHELRNGARQTMPSSAGSRRGHADAEAVLGGPAERQRRYRDPVNGIG